MGSTGDQVYLLDRDEVETQRYRRYRDIPTHSPQIFPAAQGPDSSVAPLLGLLLIFDSLNNQHRFLVDLSNLIHPSIPKDLTAVADLGTGTGVWLEDVANLLPNKSVYLHGFDISSAQYPRGHEIPRPGQKSIPLSVHDALHPLPTEHCGRYDLVHIRLLTAGLQQGDYTRVLANARALLKPNGWIQWEEVDHTAFCTDAVPEPAAITRLRDSVVEAMLKLGLWPFAPKRVYEEVSANGFTDVVRETYTTVGKEHMRPTAQKWVATAMRALVPASMVVTGEARDADQARVVVEGLIREFEAHCESATALINFGVTVGRRVD